MDFTHLQKDYNDLLSYLKNDGYTQSVGRHIKIGENSKLYFP